MRGDTIFPICTITSGGYPHAPRWGVGAKTTEVGTVLSPPCSNPSAAVLCHNKPVLKSHLVGDENLTSMNILIV